MACHSTTGGSSFHSTYTGGYILVGLLKSDFSSDGEH